MTFQITKMTVNGLENCASVDSQHPVFGWQIDGERMIQRSWRVTVLDKEEILWDSGTVQSSRMYGITYEGKPLASEQAYTWKVIIEDENGCSEEGVSSFETAFFDHSMKAWDGAEWIGTNHLSLNTSALTVFKMNCTLALNQNVQRAGFMFGGDDERLMDENRNLYGMHNSAGESWCALMLDVSGMEKGECAKLLVYRKNYTPDDTDAPLVSCDISPEIINAGNRFDEHTLYMECEFGQLELYVDGEDGEHSLLPPVSDNMLFNMNRRINVNPMGRGGDYICYPDLGRIGFIQDGEGNADFRQLQVRNYRKPCNVLYSGKPEVNQLTDVSHGANVMLASSVSLKKNVRKARVYATARGVYELYINGRKVSEDMLAPGLLQYDRHHYYQVYDVTDQLCTGKNGIGAVLAEGWFSGAISFSGSNWNYFGDRSSLLLKMSVEYDDGSREVFTTDHRKWKKYEDGPVRYASIFQGEERDMRLEDILNDFTKPDYDLENWENAEVIACDETVSCVHEDTVTFTGSVEQGLDYERMQLYAQPDRSVRAVEKLTAVSVTEPRKGVFIYDMGQNMAGVEEILIDGREGQKIRMRFAEILYPELPEYKGYENTMMLENIRAARAEDIFVLREGKQILSPSFTYHGYRYVEITGIDEALPVENVRGLSISSLQEITADFKCSDPLINRLYQNIAWSFRDNYISIPSDCPQRNERMGWSGDLSVFSRTAVSMSMSAPFLHRHLQSMRDTQVNGRFADISPLGGGFGGTLWGSAGMTVPYEMYRQYGDVQIFEEHYDAMKSYMEFLKSTKNEQGIVTDGPLGDWLSPENTMNESAYLWQCYYIFDLSIMAEAAEVLGRTEDAEVYRAEREQAKKDFIRIYIDQETGMSLFSSEEQAVGLNSPFEFGVKERIPERTASGRYIMDTQTSYAVPLALGVLDGDAAVKAAEYLDRACRRKNTDDLNETHEPYALMTGFIGTAWILQALSEYGYDETAWRMLKEKRYPSWLYPVWNGATTIWERLNSYTREKGFGGNNSMNSFNHYSFGAVGTWMRAYAGGVRRGSEPGTFRIAPVPDLDGEVTWTEVSVKTVSGTYQVRWHRNGEKWEYVLDLPAGRMTSCTLPAGCSAGELASRCLNTEGFINVREEGDKVSFDAYPGHYEI